MSNYTPYYEALKASVYFPSLVKRESDEEKIPINRNQLSDKEKR